MNLAMICSDSLRPVTLNDVPRETAIAEKEWLFFCQSRKLGYEIDPDRKFGLLSWSITSCSGCG